MPEHTKNTIETRAVAFKENHAHAIWRLVFYAGWTVVLFLSAYLTPLLDDEAYYWVYSTHLSLGYHDHPPAIALLIRAGYAIFPNELGVRLFPALCHLLTLFVLERIVVPKNFLRFGVLISGITVFQFSGFWAVPDTPFLLACSLFWWAVVNYYKKDTAWSALGLGLSVALVLWSKYHGAMLVFFLMLFGSPMFRRPSLYWAMAVSALAYFPHLLWLVENDFPSFVYHFSGRHTAPYRISQTIHYLLSQWLILGVVSGSAMIVALFTMPRPQNLEKIGLRAVWAIWGFLFLFSFRGHVEGNWSLASLPLLLSITYPEIERWKISRTAMAGVVAMAVVSFVAGRSIMIYDWLPVRVSYLQQFYSQKEWVSVVHKMADGRPVFFMNSYQKASKYQFYSGEKAHSSSNIMGRPSQYDLMGVPPEWMGKPAIWEVNWKEQRLDSLVLPRGRLMHYYVDTCFSYFPRAKITCKGIPERASAGTSIAVDLAVNVPSQDLLNVPDCGKGAFRVSCSFFNADSVVYTHTTETTWPLSESTKSSTLLTLPSMKGRFRYVWSLSKEWYPPGLNSRQEWITLE